jgi:tryptophan synthase beta chain
MADKLKSKNKTRFVGVEPTSCASLTKGKYEYDFGDTAQMTPLFKMYTMGSDYVPSPIHAGGLRYHGMSPQVSFLYNEKLVEAVAYDQSPVFQAGIDFARAEGIIPAPESSHAIKAAMDEAIKARKEGKKKVILFNLSGHGLLDLNGYDKFLHNKL